MHPFLILGIAVAIVLIGILVLRLHAFLALLIAGLTVASLTPASTLESFAGGQVEQARWTPSQAEDFLESTPAARVARAFGSTAGNLGILIAMASIIGKCLLDSGAADRIVRTTLRLVGMARASLALVGSSFVLGIPVFFDTVFFLMMPLGKALRLRTGGHYLLYILAIVAGGSMAHSLIPPTPGPLYVADQLGVNLFAMILGGTIVCIFSSTVSYLFARWLDRRMEIPLRESPDLTMADLEASAQRTDRELPPFLLALLPIVLPVVLIAGQTGMSTYLDSFPDDVSPPVWAQRVQPTVDAVGDRNVALMLAAAIALGMLAWQKRTSRRELMGGVQSALASGGVIILITSAGGAFGASVQQSGISEEVAARSAGIDPLWILPLAFLVTALIRTAQGSATVAMITAVGVLQHFATSGELTFHPVYLALAIGCGSKPVAWMADSGFWVICKMSGMTEAEGLKTITPLSCVMGFAGLFATLIGAWLFPFA